MKSDTVISWAGTQATRTGSREAERNKLPQTEGKRSRYREPHLVRTVAMKKYLPPFLPANPSGADRLMPGLEARSPHAELKRSGFRDRFNSVTRWAETPLDQLRGAPEFKPTVVHLSRHGCAHTPEATESTHGRHVVATSVPSIREPFGLPSTTQPVARRVGLARSDRADAQCYGSLDPGCRTEACFAATIAEYCQYRSSTAEHGPIRDCVPNTTTTMNRPMISMPSNTRTTTLTVDTTAFYASWNYHQKGSHCERTRTSAGCLGFRTLYLPRRRQYNEKGTYCWN